MSKKPKASKNKAQDTDTKSVKLEITVKDRLVHGDLLPQQGDILTLTLAKDIGEKLRLTQADMKTAGFERSPGQKGFTWKKEITRKVVFTNAEIEFLRAQVDRLDKEKKITTDILSLCLKIRQKE